MKAISKILAATDCSNFSPAVPESVTTVSELNDAQGSAFHGIPEKRAHPVSPVDPGTETTLRNRPTLAREGLGRVGNEWVNGHRSVTAEARRVEPQREIVMAAQDGAVEPIVIETLGRAVGAQGSWGPGSRCANPED